MEEEKRDSFVFYRSFYDGILSLPKEEQANVIMAICEYSLNDNIPEDISPVARAMLMVMKPNIDNASRRYKASVENGKKGGRPRKTTTEDKPNENLEKPKQNLNKPSNNLDEPKQNLNDNDNVNDNYNINNNININNIKSETKVSDKQVIDLPTNKFNTQKECFYVTKEYLTQMQELYSNVNVLEEFKKMKAWLLNNPTKRKTLRGMTKFINNWLSKKQDQPIINTQKQQPVRQEIVPDWLNKNIDITQTTAEEQAEMANLLKEEYKPNPELQARLKEKYGKKNAK